MYKKVGHFCKTYEEKCSSKYKIAISHENAMLYYSFYWKNPHKLLYLQLQHSSHLWLFFLKLSMLIIDIITVISDMELAKINGLSFD